MRDLIHEPLIARQLTALQRLPDEGPLAGWNHLAQKAFVGRASSRLGIPQSEVAGIRMEPDIAVEPRAYTYPVPTRPLPAAQQGSILGPWLRLPRWDSHSLKYVALPSRCRPLFE